MQAFDVPWLTTQVLWAAFFLSLIFGGIAQRTHFCTMGAVSDVVNMGDCELYFIAGPDRGTTPPSAVVHQDARMYAAVLGAGDAIDYPLPKTRYAWVHCAQGNITLNGHALKEGDGAALSDESAMQIAGAGPNGGEFLVFDLA